MDKGRKEEDSLAKAVALKYRPYQDKAPKVTAKGTGRIARKIISLAKEHGIPIKEDPVLVEFLSKLELGQEIPPDLYIVVAEILAFIYSKNLQWHRREEKN